MKAKNIIIIIPAAAPAGSISLNVMNFSRMVRYDNIHFGDANTRETYRTIHNLDAAHKLATGKSVKVGILDWDFAVKQDEDLYSGGVEFMSFKGHETNYTREESHGFWMAYIPLFLSQKVHTFSSTQTQGFAHEPALPLYSL